MTGRIDNWGNAWAEQFGSNQTYNWGLFSLFDEFL
jgi:hypothetical protein